MIKIGPKYVKLKADLNLACKRLQMLQAKKMELSQKLQKEISNHLNKGKFMLAKIKVQTVIRYEAAQEAMEIIEMLCEQILDRYGLFEEKKELDQSLEQAVSSLMWVSPYMRSEVFELKDIFKQLSAKYGSDYSKSALKNKKLTVNSELIERVKITIPSEDKIQEYLRYIAEKNSVPEDRKKEMEAYFSKSDSFESKKRSQNNPRLLSSSPQSPETIEDVGDQETFEGYGTSVPHTSSSCKKVFSNLNFEKNKRPRVRWARYFFNHNALPTIPEEDENLETDDSILDQDRGIPHKMNESIDDGAYKGNATSGSPRVSHRNRMSEILNVNAREIPDHRNKEVPTATEIGSNFFRSTYKKKGNFRMKIPTRHENDTEFGFPEEEIKNMSEKVKESCNLYPGKDALNDFEDNSSTYTASDKPPSYDAVVCNKREDKLDIAPPYQFEVDIKLECFPQYSPFPTCPALEELSEQRFENARLSQNSNNRKND